MKESEYIDLIEALADMAGNVRGVHGNKVTWQGEHKEALEQARSIVQEREEARRKAGTRIDYQAWLNHWNKNRGDLPQVRSLTKKRRAAIKKLCDDVGHDEAWEAFQLAVDNVAADPWWAGENPGKKVYGFDNLVVHDKVMQKAESEEAEETFGAPKESMIQVGAKVRVMGWLTGIVEDSRIAVTGEPEYRVHVEKTKSSWFPARDVEEV